MTSTTIWKDFETLFVQLDHSGAEIQGRDTSGRLMVDPKVLDTVHRLRSKHDSDRDLHQQQQVELDHKRKQAQLVHRERLELSNGKLKVELNRSAASVEDLQESLARREDEVLAGEERFQKVRLELREERAEIANLQNRLKVASDEMNLMKSRHANQWSKLAQEREGLSSQLNDRSEALESERALAEQRQIELEKRDREIGAVRQEIAAQQVEIERLNNASIDAKSRSSQNRVTQAQIDVLREQLKETRAAQEVLCAGVEQRRVELHAAQAHRKSLESIQTDAVSSLSAVAPASSDEARLREELSSTRSALIKHQNIIATEEMKKNALQAEQAQQIEFMQGRIIELQTQGESAKEALVLQESKRSAQPGIKTEFEEDSAAHERMSTLEAQTLEIKKQIPGLQAELNSTQEALQNRLCKAATLKFKAEDAEENLDTIRSQIARAKEQGARLQKRLEIQEAITEKKEAETATSTLTALPSLLSASQPCPATTEDKEPLGRLAAANSIKQQRQKLQASKEAMLQETLDSLADRAKDVSDKLLSENVSGGRKTGAELLAHLRQKDRGWVSEPRRMQYQPLSKMAPDPIPECVSECGGDAPCRKPTSPPVAASGSSLLSRIDALAMSVTNIAAENDVLEQTIRIPLSARTDNTKVYSSAPLEEPESEALVHSRTSIMKHAPSLSTTQPSTDGSSSPYEDGMSSPRDHYQKSSRRQRSRSPGWGTAFEQQHTIPELSSKGGEVLPFRVRIL